MVIGPRGAIAAQPPHLGDGSQGRQSGYEETTRPRLGGAEGARVPMGGWRRWCAGAAAVMVVVAAYRMGRARADGIPTTPAMYFGATLDEGGAPMSGPIDLTVRLWDAATAGTMLCQTVATGAVATVGRVRVGLDAACATAVQQNPNVWAELIVGSRVIGVRTKLGAVPYAVEAQRAVQALGVADGGALATRLNELSAAVPTWYLDEQTTERNVTAAWTDIPGLTRTLTFTRTQKVNAIIAGAMGYGGPMGEGCQVRVTMNSLPGDGLRRIPALSGVYSGWSYLYFWPAVPAGTWTFSVQVIAAQPTGNCSNAQGQLMLMVH